MLLLFVDTLRADRLGCYGYTQRPTSPAIDALARGGAVFDQAFATASWTAPSAASLLTSLYPTEHGVLTARRTPSGEVLIDSPLSPHLDSLAVVLQRAGYATRGVVSNYLLDRPWGFDAGFDEFSMLQAEGHDQESAVVGGLVADQALAWLDELAEGGAPFFLMAHFFDPHALYMNHEEIAFTDGGALPEGMAWGGKVLNGALEKMTAPERAPYLETLAATYDEEIAHTDAQMGRILARLDELGLAENTLVVFTADHGEYFMERDREGEEDDKRHAWIGHGRELFEELLRVPLIIRGPDVEPGRQVDGPVSLLDVLPTVIDLAALPRLGTAPRGRSLRSILAGGDADADRPIFAEIHFSELEDGALMDDGQIYWTKRSVRAGGWKLVENSLRDTRLLMDTGVAVAERSDEADRQTDQVERLGGLLQKWRSRLAPVTNASPQAMTAEEARQLIGLGYLDEE